MCRPATLRGRPTDRLTHRSTGRMTDRSVDQCRIAARRLSLALLVLAACQRGDDEAPAAPPSPNSTVALQLAAEPSYDLMLNRARFHLHDAGLVVPFAGAGFRIYDLALRDVWGPWQGATRALRGTARLLLPWRGGRATLTVHGAGSGKIVVDGRALSLRLGKSGAVATAAFDLGELSTGEHEVTIAPQGRLQLAQLELAAPGATGCGGDPVPSSAAELAGGREFEIAVELPAHAALAFTALGGAAVVAVRGEDGVRKVLWRGRGNGVAQVVELGMPAQLAILSLESPGCDVRWQAARLGVIASASSPIRGMAKPARHVVLIVVDTLRADRVAAVTDTRVATPRLTAAVQRGGVAFARNLAVAPSSPPSHTTIHTGLLPRVHGVVGDTAPLRADAPMLSAILAERGFYTGYVGNNDFAMGRLTKAARWTEHHAPVFEGQGVDCAPLVERAVKMMARALATNQRAFLSLLPIEPHVPYRFHDGITQRYFAGPFTGMLGKRVTSAHLSRVRARGLPGAGWKQLRALYDGEITYFDGCFGALEDGLAKLGAADDTAIVLTSDHGEGLGERGNNTGHAYSLNHELTWVPLLVFGGGARLAAAQGLRRWTGATSNLDIAPTVLELLGEPVDARMQGRSLLPIVRGGSQWPRAVAAEYGRAYAVFAGRWHYVADYEGRGKLYDVLTDPAETRDRSGDAAVALRYLREAAAMFLSQRVTWRGSYGSWTELSRESPLQASPAQDPRQGLP